MGHWSTWWALWWNFLWVGALGFGGGFGMLPLMRAVSLSHHWVNAAGFDQAVAFGQITPGPVAIGATFIGERAAGWIGAAISTLAVFLPSASIMAALVVSWPRVRRWPWIHTVMATALAAVVGLIAAVSLNLAFSLVRTLLDAALAAAAFLASRRFSVPYWAIVLGAAGIGALAFKP
ncbi:MAG: chromate transporter [Firmicutes bacterium]|nr:chromate transporter [Bacillota bacterium]